MEMVQESFIIHVGAGLYCIAGDSKVDFLCKELRARVDTTSAIIFLRVNRASHRAKYEA